MVQERFKWDLVHHSGIGSRLNQLNMIQKQRTVIGLKGLWYTDRKHIITSNKVYVFIYLVTSLIVNEDVSI